MIKTQVLIPDALLQEAERVAAENEMSFAQVVCLGLEEFVQHYPPGRVKTTEWKLPSAQDLGETLAPEQDWTALCHE